MGPNISRGIILHPNEGEKLMGIPQKLVCILWDYFYSNTVATTRKVLQGTWVVPRTAR